MPKVVTPEVELQSLEKEIVPIVVKAEKLVTIKDAKDMEKASELRTQLKSYAKQVKERKETITKPANALLKAVRALFAPLEDRVDDTLSAIDAAMIAYQTEEKKRAAAEEAKLLDRVGKGKLKLDTAVRKADEIERPAAVVKGDAGGTQFITTPVFEVEDVSLLPKDYILPDMVKIRAAMKAGNQLPGVRYWTEERPRDVK